MRGSAIWAGSALAIVAGGHATAQQATQRPKYQLFRANEDWSVLRSTSREEGWDRWKFVPLGEDENGTYASFGGHARFRAEAFDNFAFGAPAQDTDQYSVWRLLLHADVHLNEDLRIFVEGKHANIVSRDLPGGARRLDADTLALEQAHVDYTLVVPVRSSSEKSILGKRGVRTSPHEQDGANGTSEGKA